MAAKKKAIKAVKKTTATKKAAPKKSNVPVSNIGKTQLVHLRAIIGESISGMGRLMRQLECKPSTKWEKYETGEEKIPVDTLEKLADYAITHKGAKPCFRNTSSEIRVVGFVSKKTLVSAKPVADGYKVTCKFVPKAKRGTLAKEHRSTFSVVSDKNTNNGNTLAFITEVCSDPA